MVAGFDSGQTHFLQTTHNMIQFGSIWNTVAGMLEMFKWLHKRWRNPHHNFIQNRITLGAIWTSLPLLILHYMTLKRRLSDQQTDIYGNLFFPPFSFHFLLYLGRRPDSTAGRCRRIKLHPGAVPGHTQLRRGNPEQAEKVQLRPRLWRTLHPGKNFEIRRSSQLSSGFGRKDKHTPIHPEKKRLQKKIQFSK